MIDKYRATDIEKHGSGVFATRFLAPCIPDLQRLTASGMQCSSISSWCWQGIREHEHVELLCMTRPSALQNLFIYLFYITELRCMLKKPSCSSSSAFPVAVLFASHLRLAPWKKQGMRIASWSRVGQASTSATAFCNTSCSAETREGRESALRVDICDKSYGIPELRYVQTNRVAQVIPPSPCSFRSPHTYGELFG